MLTLQEKEFGPGSCLIIGEVAQAHDGSLGMAHAFIDAIAQAGADAVKFQTHIAAAESSSSEPWRIKFSPQDATRFDYWKRMEFTPEQWAGLKRHAEEKGLLFLSSPFSEQATDLLAGLDMVAWKVASGEINNPLLFARMLRHPRPFLISSGMSPWAEIDWAVEQVRAAGMPLILMQCTTAYPCPPEKVGLNMLAEFRTRYGCEVGLSDHSGTIFPALAAATLGASAIEVHVALSRDMFGPDVPASVTPSELQQIIQGIRFIETSLAHPMDKDEFAAEMDPLRRTFNKSVVVRRNLEAGVVLSQEDLTAKKPGMGIPVAQVGSLVGRKLKRSVLNGAFLSEEDLEQA